MVENYNFENQDHEKNYCAHNRVQLMPAIMNDMKCNLFWLDADVYLRGDIGDFFELYTFY